MRIGRGQDSACTIRPPVRCSSSIYLKLLPIVCLAIRVWYVSRPNTLKSWISEKIIVAFLRSRAFHAHFSRAGIMGIWRGIGFFIWRYPHWVKSEANIPNRLGILRALIYLVFWLHNYFIFESGFQDFKLQFVRKSHPNCVVSVEMVNLVRTIDPSCPLWPSLHQWSDFAPFWVWHMPEPS